MFVLISISSEVFSRMMAMRLMQRRLGFAASATRDAPELLQRVRGTFGGRLILLDWGNQEILADKAILGVTGFAAQVRGIVASSWIDPHVYILEDGKEVGRFTHPWFNYIHSVDVTPRRTILLASAGSDLIAEFTPDGEVLWEWFGAEHGYGLRPDGNPAFFDRSVDYRPLRSSTAEQAMHVTSAILLPNERVLATLFHQGTLISIDRNNGAACVLLDGLSRPHGVHLRDGGYLLSDTLGHRIVLLNEDLHVCGEIPFGAQWLQDAISTSAGSYLTLENVHIDQLPEPNLSNRIAEIDEKGKLLRALEIGADSRLFTVREIGEPLARALVDAWGRTANFDAWRWS